MSKLIKLSFFILIIIFIKPIYAMDSDFSHRIKIKEDKSEQLFKSVIRPNISIKEITDIVLSDPLQQKLRSFNYVKSTEMAKNIISETKFPMEIIKLINDYQIDFDFILKLFNFLKRGGNGYSSRYFLTGEETAEQKSQIIKERNIFIRDMFNSHTYLKYQNCICRFFNMYNLDIYKCFVKYNFNKKSDNSSFEYDRLSAINDYNSRILKYVIITFLFTIASICSIDYFYLNNKYKAWQILLIMFFARIVWEADH